MAFPAHEDRFIPTPVGNTDIEKMLEETSTVYPHTRGEHQIYIIDFKEKLLRYKFYQQVEANKGSS